MTVFEKIKWVVAILFVFLIILATNLIDQKNFLKVEEAIENIYEDRLLAKELLMGLTIQFHEKELSYALNDSVYLETQNDAINSDIIRILQIFEKATETRNENMVLHKLNENHSQLIQLESNGSSDDKVYNKKYSVLFSAINENIKELSMIQVKEGRNQKLRAQDAVNSVKLFTKIEIYLLVFLGLIIQIIILYQPKKKVDE